MNPDKQYILDELKGRVDESPFVLVVDYTGVTVPEFDELRSRLSEAGAECHVAKNTFMKRVLSDAGLPDIGDKLVGQTAFITGDSDVCAVAKAVKNFKKEFEKPEVRAGILDGAVLDAAQVAALADLPSREVMLGMLLSTINAPATKLLRTLNEPGGSLARVIKAKFPDEG